MCNSFGVYCVLLFMQPDGAESVASSHSSDSAPEKKAASLSGTPTISVSRASVSSGINLQHTPAAPFSLRIEGLRAPEHLLLFHFDIDCEIGHNKHSAALRLRPISNAQKRLLKVSTCHLLLHSPLPF